MPAQHVNSQQFEVILKKSKYVLVDFTATWCPPCKMMSPIIDAFSEDIDLQKITFIKVDTDQEADLSAEFGIMSLPTFLLLKTNPSGGYEEVAKYIGGQEPITFKDKLISLVHTTDTIETTNE